MKGRGQYPPSHIRDLVRRPAHGTLLLQACEIFPPKPMVLCIVRCLLAAARGAKSFITGKAAGPPTPNPPPRAPERVGFALCCLPPWLLDASGGQTAFRRKKKVCPLGLVAVVVLYVISGREHHLWEFWGQQQKKKEKLYIDAGSNYYVI